MSRKMAKLVYSRRLGSSVRKGVLAFMAECASDDGTGVWASKRTIAASTELGRSSVIKACNEFLEEGLIEVTGSRRCASGATTEYRLNVSKIEALQEIKDGPKVSTSGTAKGVHQRDQSTSGTGGVHQRDPKVSTSGTQTVLEPSFKEDTIVSSVKSKPSKKKRASQIRDDAHITAPMLKAAAKRGHSPVEAEAQFQRFKDHALSKGRVCVCWDAAYRSWLDSQYFKPITVITGGQHGASTSKSRGKMAAFTSGARGTG